MLTYIGICLQDFVFLCFNILGRQTCGRMCGGMVSDYMPLGDHPADQVGLALGIRKRYKEGCFDTFFLQRIQHRSCCTVFIALINCQVDFFCTILCQRCVHIDEMCMIIFILFFVLHACNRAVFFICICALSVSDTFPV